MKFKDLNVIKKPKNNQVYALIFLLILSSLNSLAGFLTEAEVREIEGISREIVTRCDPRNCVVIGIGRSPSVLVAYLQGLKDKYAVNLPLSSFRYGIGSNPNLTAEQETTLKKHFDHFIPSNDSIESKKIVLLDYSRTAGSLIASKKYIEKYLREVRGIEHPDLQIFSITNEKDEPSVKKNLEGTPKSLILPIRAGTPLYDLFLNSSFDSLSEYGPYDIQTCNSQVSASPLYGSLVTEIANLLRSWEGKGALGQPNWYLAFKRSLTHNDPVIRRYAGNSFSRLDDVSLLPAQRSELYQIALNDKDEELAGSIASHFLETYKGNDFHVLFQMILARCKNASQLFYLRAGSGFSRRIKLNLSDANQLVSAALKSECKEFIDRSIHNELRGVSDKFAAGLFEEAILRFPDAQRDIQNSIQWFNGNKVELLDILLGSENSNVREVGIKAAKVLKARIVKGLLNEAGLKEYLFKL